MKRIIGNLLLAGLILGFATSCETYKVQDPEMTAVSDFDGKWICYGINGNDTTIFQVVITNTESNASDKLWVTMVDCNPEITGYAYLDAVRFKANCNSSNLSFDCENSDMTYPATAWSWLYDQNTNTAGYRAIKSQDTVVGKATIKDGKIEKEVVFSYGDTKQDAISFTYTRAMNEETPITYQVKGMKINGWYEDMQEYVDFMFENF